MKLQSAQRVRDRVTGRDVIDTDERERKRG